MGVLAKSQIRRIGIRNSMSLMTQLAQHTPLSYGMQLGQNGEMPVMKVLTQLLGMIILGQIGIGIVLMMHLTMVVNRGGGPTRGASVTQVFVVSLHAEESISGLSVTPNLTSGGMRITGSQQKLSIGNSCKLEESIEPLAA